MKQIQLPSLKKIAGIVLMGIITCSSLQAEQDLLINPSIHIMVNNNESIATSGTYAFDTKIFKVNPVLKVDIADFDSRLIKVINTYMNETAFKASEENPDFLVNYAVAANSPITEADFKSAYIGDSAFELPKFELGNALKYNRGALIIDIVDAKTKKILWRGAIMAELKKDVSPEVRDRRLQLAVKSLLTHFPKPILKK